MSKPKISIQQIGKLNFWFGILAGTFTTVSLTLFTLFLKKYFFLLYWVSRISINAEKQYLPYSPYKVKDEYFNISVNPYFNEELHNISHLLFTLVFTSIGFGIMTYIWITNKTYLNSLKRRRTKLYRSHLSNTIWSFLQAFSRVGIVLGFFIHLNNQLHKGAIAFIFILVFTYFMLLSVTSLRTFYRIKAWGFPFFIGIVLVSGVTYLSSKQSYDAELKALDYRILQIEEEAISSLTRYDETPPPPPPPNSDTEIK